VIRVSRELLGRYNTPSPRYTSYPTLMHWGAPPTAQQWVAALDEALSAADGALSLYTHIPFCQSLCGFCGCNMRLVRNHALAAPYVATLLQEFALYRERLTRPTIALGQFHLGGGSPTYLPAAVLDQMLDGILQHVDVLPDADLAIEADPRNTTREQLVVLRRHGFNRLSLGVQDFDTRVLEIVNREQSESDVRRVVQEARELGFKNISFDLIYGLPLQTVDSLNNTFDLTLQLRPDRLSFLPYAHVPWIKPSQRRYTDADLPDNDARLQLLTTGRERLGGAGYEEIGLDQYALTADPLSTALQHGQLHRNFMGFTASRTQALLGLGVSAIGNAGNHYAQNEKSLAQYEARISDRALPLQRGHRLDAADQRIREHIWNLFSASATRISSDDESAGWWPTTHTHLQQMRADELVLIDGKQIAVAPKGRAFLRQIAAAFDVRNRAGASVRNDAA
jgi:oxygen-independent coproporphyrinogen III oxidase